MDMGPGGRPEAQKLLGRDLGGSSFWALGPAPGPISIMAEHMRIKGNEYAINRQSKTGSRNYNIRVAFALSFAVAYPRTVLPRRVVLDGIA